MSDSKSRRRYRVDRCASRRFARSGSAAENRLFPCRWVCWSKRLRKSFRRERTTMLRAERTAKETTRANREALYRWRIVPRMLRDVSKRDLSVEVLGAHLPAPARSGDVRQRDSPRGGYFQGSRAGGTTRAVVGRLPLCGAGGGGRRRRAGGTAESACWSGFDHGAERVRLLPELDAAALCKSGSSELLRQPQL